MIGIPVLKQRFRKVLHEGEYLYNNGIKMQSVRSRCRYKFVGSLLGLSVGIYIMMLHSRNKEGADKMGSHRLEQTAAMSMCTLYADDMMGSSRRVFYIYYEQEYKSHRHMSTCFTESAVLSGASTNDHTVLTVLTDNIVLMNNLLSPLLSTVNIPNSAVSIEICGLQKVPDLLYKLSQLTSIPVSRMSDLKWLVRLSILYLYGGTYLDVDTIPISPVVFTQDFPVVAQVAYSDSDRLITDSYLHFPTPGHPFLLHLIQMYLAEVDKSRKNAAALDDFTAGILFTDRIFRECSSYSLSMCKDIRVVPSTLTTFTYAQDAPTLLATGAPEYDAFAERIKSLWLMQYHYKYLVAECSERFCVMNHTGMSKLMSYHCPLMSQHYRTNIYCHNTDHIQGRTCPRKKRQ